MLSAAYFAPVTEVFLLSLLTESESFPTGAGNRHLVPFQITSKVILEFQKQFRPRLRTFVPDDHQSSTCIHPLARFLGGRSSRPRITQRLVFLTKPRRCIVEGNPSISRPAEDFLSSNRPLFLILRRQKSAENLKPHSDLSL